MNSRYSLLRVSSRPSRRLALAAVFAAVSTMTIGGCGSSFESSVSGKVTLGGAPLTKGSVSFHPVVSGPVAIASIASDGSYTIKTGTKVGLTPGDYVVTVTATDPPPAGQEELPGTLLTPEEYGDVKRSPLKHTVKAGSNTIHLDVPAKAN